MAGRIALRGGAETADRRLDRLPELDPRSRDYPVRRHLAAGAPIRARVWRLLRSLMGDQGREGACFPPGTLVRMADGTHRAIEDVRTLDLVATAEGGTGHVLATSARLYAGDMLRIRLRGHGALRCTPEHPILTDRGYVMASELRIGDRVALTRRVARTIGDGVPLAAHAFEQRSPSHALKRTVRHYDRHGGVTVSRVATVPGVLDFSEDLGRLLGLYLAEGNTTENRAVWTFGRHEADTLVPETVALIQRAFGAEARIQVRPNGVRNVVLYGKPWRMALDSLCGAGSAEKRLHPDIAQGPDGFRRALLGGWLAGDGHVRGHWTVGRTVSHRLALDMFAIAQDLGLRPTLAVDDPKPSHGVRRRRRIYTLGIATGGGANAAPFDDAAVWRSVRAIEADDFAGFVHNLTVEGDESYVAEGVSVHNCVEFGLLHVLACLPVAQALAVLRAIRGEHLIYWPAQHDDPWPGGEYPGASPREGGTSETTAMRFLKAVGVISEFSWAFDFDAAVQGVVNVGPANLALAWTDGMMEASREGLIRDQGPVVGGHDVAWIGVQPGKRIDGQRIDVAVIAQSWGLDYGDRGRVYLPLDDLARRVADDGTVAFLHGEQRIDLDRLRQAASAVLAR